MSDHPSELEFKLKHILTAVKDVATEWHELGLHLDLPEHILKLIGSSPDFEGHLRMMLSKWLDYGLKASWDKLANALNTMGKNVLAENIRSKYVGAVTVLDTSDVSDDDSKTRQEINRNILQLIKCQFASLVLKVRSAMEARQVKVSDVHQFLMTSFQGDCCIPEVPDHTKLFNIITQAKLWRYDHYVPLQQLAQQFLQDDEQIRTHITDYRNQLSAFCATTKIIDFFKLSELDELEDNSQQSFSPGKYIKKDYRKLKVKLKLKNITELTLGYVNTLWQSFAEEFGFPSLTAVIDKIIDGSLVISWLILPHIADKIRASNSKALRFYQRHSIVKVNIDDDLLYDEEWIADSTPLYQASSMGNADEVKELLEGGADVNEPNDNKFGDTALFGACRGGHAETARILLDYGANVDLKNKIGKTSLMVASGSDSRDVASGSDSRDVVRVLLEAKADPNIADDKYGGTALHLAAYWGHVEVVKMLVKYGAVVNIRNKRGATGLMKASFNGHTDTVRVLLEAKTDPNITYENGSTALHWAAENGRVETVKMLMKYGVRLDIRNRYGMTGLMEASINGHTDTVRALLEAKPDPNNSDEGGRTALHHAAVMGEIEVVKVLVKYGAALDIRDEDGKTGLILASDNGLCDTVRVLLEAKADPNITDKNGDTALHQAAQRSYGSYIEVVKLLVKYGASVDIANMEGLTALDVVRAHGQHGQAVREILEQYTKQETRTELTQEQKESFYQRLLKMAERIFLREQVRKREEQQKEHQHHQREERIGGEREKRSLWNRLTGRRRDRPGQIVGTAPASEK